MSELERVTAERNLALARLHTTPKENTGAWWRGECPDWCDACKLVELNKQVERLVREDERRLAIAEPARPPAPPAAPAFDLVKQARLYGEGFLFPETRGEYEEDLVDFAEQVTAVLRTELARAESELEKFKAENQRLRERTLNGLVEINRFVNERKAEGKGTSCLEAVRAALTEKGSEL